MSEKNIVDLQGEDIVFESDVLSDEQNYAKKTYSYLGKEIDNVKNAMPYPDITPFSVAGYLDPHDLKYKKSVMAPYWEKIDLLDKYYSDDSLYSGHTKTDVRDCLFTETPWLKTTIWNIDGREVMLVNADDMKYRDLVDDWHFPKKNSSVIFSRNVTMLDKQVKAVDTIIDRNNDMYAQITDNYLRKALMRNKDKQGFGSIIQTIQEKQDHIRALAASRSFVVQGCAGSGKTMVLLHRLRYLLYNKAIHNEDFWFLVPSQTFKKYISDITNKFGISQKSIASYQGYYQYLMGRNPDNVEDSNELVFAPEYLSYVYSRDFMEKSYLNYFHQIVHKGNLLCDFCEEKLSSLMEAEREGLIEKSYKTQDSLLSHIKRRTLPIINELKVNLKDFISIPVVITRLNGVLEEYREIQRNLSEDLDNIVIAQDDPRILADETLRQMNSDVDLQAARVKKATIFTSRAHKSKLKVLEETRDKYYEELLAKVVEEEKALRKEKAMQMSRVFENATYAEAEAILADISRLYTDAKKTIDELEYSIDNIENVFAKKYEAEILAMNTMIEESSMIKDHCVDWSRKLESVTDQLINYIQTGKSLYTSFLRRLTKDDNTEKFKEDFVLFHNRTDRELLSYLHTLLMGINRKRIRERFDIKLSQVYKHFWYISAYSRYLIYGNADMSKRTHIFIDEAQDLSAMEIDLIRKINTPTEKQKSHLPVMNIFGDTNQMISKHGIERWSDLKYISDEFMLDENFRNTNQIVDYCNNKLKLNMKKIGVDMSPVEEKTSVDDAKSLLLQDDGIAIVVKDEYAKQDLIYTLPVITRSNAQVYTVKDVKGLEFRNVLVVDRDMTRNERYIAYTRALSKLYVIHSLPVVFDQRESLIVQGEE